MFYEKYVRNREVSGINRLLIDAALVWPFFAINHALRDENDILLWANKLAAAHEFEVELINGAL
jgi:hypothetical protein